MASLSTAERRDEIYGSTFCWLFSLVASGYSPSGAVGPALDNSVSKGQTRRKRARGKNDTQIGNVKEPCPLASGLFAIHTINCSGHPCGPPLLLCEVGQAAMLAIKTEGFGLAHSQGAANQEPITRCTVWEIGNHTLSGSQAIYERPDKPKLMLRQAPLFAQNAFVNYLRHR
jgi:hypothetical protein